MGAWRVEHRVGDASELHAEPMDLSERTVRVHRVDRPAIVLGSTQPDAVLDSAVLRRRGLQRSRRHSGGGAVHLDPERSLWVDLSIPSSDPLWQTDVERAAWWVGDAWAATFADVAAPSAIEVHRGGLSDKELGRVACFASSGPGEVSIGGRKVVGISQRRTRDGARFQCVVYSVWDPTPLLEALGPAGADPRLHTALHEAVAPIPEPGGWSVVEQLLQHLP